jgi:hypothetical protein
VFIDTQHKVDIQLASASTIRIHNANTIKVAGNVTLIWQAGDRTNKEASSRVGEQIWIAETHSDGGKRFVGRADEKLATFLELESAIHATGYSSNR